MAIDPKDALRLGLEARETLLSSGVDQNFIDVIYRDRLSPLMAKGTYKSNMVLDEWITFMLELLAFSSYAKKYGVDTWQHSPSVTLGGRSLTPDFFDVKAARYVEIYSPAQGHDHTSLDYLTDLDRRNVASTIRDKAQKYTGLQIDIVTHLSTAEFATDYAKAIQGVTVPSGQRFLLFQGDTEIQI